MFFVRALQIENNQQFLTVAGGAHFVSWLCCAAAVNFMESVSVVGRRIIVRCNPWI